MATKLREVVNFPIHQATHTNDLFKLLGGRKDDVFVYDRCGRLAFYIPFPKSYVRYRYVEAAIMTAYLDEPCGPCPNTTVACSTTTLTPSSSTSQSATPSIPLTSSSDQTSTRTTNAQQIQRNTEGSGDEHNESTIPTRTPKTRWLNRRQRNRTIFKKRRKSSSRFGQVPGAARSIVRTRNGKHRPEHRNHQSSQQSQSTSMTRKVKDAIIRNRTKKSRTKL